mmetsp:Transcript_3734/g.8669  ORF Transcript_3734/g.8669 Transcript_3734/m.8669 type:complete len:223 (+) Transcript_3734:2-670(+)
MLGIVDLSQHSVVNRLVRALKGGRNHRDLRVEGRQVGPPIVEHPSLRVAGSIFVTWHVQKEPRSLGPGAELLLVSLGHRHCQCIWATLNNAQQVISIAWYVVCPVELNLWSIIETEPGFRAAALSQVQPLTCARVGVKTKLRRSNEAPCQRTAVGAQRHVATGHEVVQVPEDGHGAVLTDGSIHQQRARVTCLRCIAPHFGRSWDGRPTPCGDQQSRCTGQR